MPAIICFREIWPLWRRKGSLKDVKLKQEQEAQKKAVQEDLLGKSLESIRDTVLVIERKSK